MAKIYRSAILLISLFIVWACQSQPLNHQLLDAKTFFELLQKNSDAIILDVRTPEEFQQGHLPNAMNINYYDVNFQSKISEMDKQKPVFVYCLSGGRSRSAAQQLQKEGFQKVFDLNGGIIAWKKQQLPLANTSSTNHSSFTLQEYNQLIEKQQLVLVDFYAEWCMPCKKMKPFLDNLSNKYEKSLHVLRIDIEKSPDFTKQFNIESIPLLFLYKNGKRVWQHNGFVSEEELNNLIEQQL